MLERTRTLTSIDDEAGAISPELVLKRTQESLNSGEFNNENNTYSFKDPEIAERLMDENDTIIDAILDYFGMNTDATKLLKDEVVATIRKSSIPLNDIKNYLSILREIPILTVESDSELEEYASDQRYLVKGVLEKTLLEELPRVEIRTMIALVKYIKLADLSIRKSGKCGDKGFYKREEIKDPNIRELVTKVGFKIISLFFLLSKYIANNPNALRGKKNREEFGDNQMGLVFQALDIIKKNPLPKSNETNNPMHEAIVESTIDRIRKLLQIDHKKAGYIPKNKKNRVKPKTVVKCDPVKV